MILEFQARIGRSMRAGGSLDDVEEEIIDRCGLDDDQKAALWLYAWSFVPRRRQRAEAGRLAAYLGQRPVTATDMAGFEDRG